MRVTLVQHQKGRRKFHCHILERKTPPNRLDNKKVICVSADSEARFGILAPSFFNYLSLKEIT